FPVRLRHPLRSNLFPYTTLFRSEELGEDRAEHAARDMEAALDRVRPVLQDLRLDDRHEAGLLAERGVAGQRVRVRPFAVLARQLDRKSTRLNSSHGSISYAVFCW